MAVSILLAGYRYRGGNRFRQPKAGCAFSHPAPRAREIVVSASAMPWWILESGFPFEERSVQPRSTNAPVANFYDVVYQPEGLWTSTASLTLGTPTTRWFSAPAVMPGNQLVEPDGMDNQAPGLNFSVDPSLASNWTLIISSYCRAPLPPCTVRVV